MTNYQKHRKAAPPPNKLPQDKVDYIVGLWCDGESMRFIADLTGVDRSTVARYCRDIPRPPPPEPLPNEVIDRLLTGWRLPA